MAEARKTRPVSWVKAALRDFRKFPAEVETICLAALTIAAEGGKADITKPLHRLGSGVLEIALPFTSDAFRVVYALRLGTTSGWSMPSRKKRRRESRRRNGRSTFSKND
jgi:phage-related protein